jgi:hypothetical protein
MTANLQVVPSGVRYDRNGRANQGRSGLARLEPVTTRASLWATQERRGLLRATRGYQTDRFKVPVAVRQIEEALQREGVRLFVSREFSAGVGLVLKR